jgi:hypothetical protein
MPGPIIAYVARMDRANPEAFLESSIATGEFATSRETVRGMATRYDEAINYWGGAWGGRNHVVVAINGDYIDKITGQPEKGQVTSGWYAKRFNDYQGESGFAWNLDRSAFIGQCIANSPKKQFITFADESTTQLITGLNIQRGSDDLVIYTPQFSSSAPTDDTGVEVFLQLSQPLTITPAPKMVKGVVVAIHDGQGGTTIPFDAVILSASGPAREKLLNNLHEGDQIGISQEIRAFEADCQTPQNADWTSTYASVGGNVTIVRDGQTQHDDEAGSLVRSPRTSIAINDQYIYFIVVDGRQPSISMGMTIDELATFVKHELDARDAISQDGGGSSTMVINGEVVNVPSDLCHKVYLPDVVNPLPETSRIELVKTKVDRIPLIDNGLCERQVANGMMMVVQEQAKRSSVFLPSMAAYTTESADVRLGPGDNFAVFARVPAYITGVIQANMNGLDGVMAKGAYWWKVSFGPVTGWVRESSLATQAAQSTPREADCEHPSRALVDRICPRK